MMVAMTIGHLAWAFVPTDTIWSEVLHFFARLTIPLACFLVVVGFELTKDVWGYVQRLFGFGVLAQIPFMGYVSLSGGIRLFDNPWFILSYGNVLFTLGFGLLTVITLDKLRHAPSLTKPLYLVPILFFGLCALWSDWGVLVLFWVSAIYWGGIYGSQALGFLMMSIVLFGVSFLLRDNPNITPYIATLNTKSLMDYGVFLAVPIMLWYERYRHRSPTHYRLPRLLFYWYYVGHLLVIAVMAWLRTAF